MKNVNYFLLDSKTAKTVVKPNSVGGKILSAISKDGIEKSELLAKIYKIEDLAPRSGKYNGNEKERETYVLDYISFLERNGNVKAESVKTAD